jgi:excisionase family DNA binding protein
MSGQLAVSVKTAAAMTDLSETTIREAIDAQHLPAYRVGRAIRVTVADLEQWLAGLIRVGSKDDQ